MAQNKKFNSRPNNLSRPELAFPGYISSRIYPFVEGNWGAAAAVPTMDTVVYLFPFVVLERVTISALAQRCVTGGAGSAVKMALWGTSPTTKRPTGIPVAGSNTGQATTGSGVTPSVAVAYTFAPGTVYWIGAAFTGTAPVMLNFLATAPMQQTLLGRSAIATSSIVCLTAPYTYATDIMALDLTAAVYTDVQVAGAPVSFFTVG